ncbi:putative CBS-domain-containing membrane protein [Thiobacillus denitrificans ATCC 25259]|uniref:Putative CBS-domain-containing membrane protein n=1 Tax=Thiobacillus denitrificans (strain ATCC 25259 / T1) TaxID=292415 RepID=Q3SGH2_THIDA|nr:HPP family protein [Thiobacillus denitrificans]AAZ98278.1 putative CBS-domain-containing membrane protein [Thiobacillus denitrificans ATCC 25259]
MKNIYTVPEVVSKKKAGLLRGWRGLKIGYTVSEREHWVSAAGGLLGMLTLLWVSHIWLYGQTGVVPIASMGASAVLLFAAPHGALSQPWSVFGGHVVSALIGVACAKWLGADPLLAASLAVALSIAAMYSLRCLHPPGGATAMYAVLGGESVHALGYGYAFDPVALNAIILILMAVAFNYPFPWRRYPEVWWRQKTAETVQTPSTEEKCMIPHSDLVYALSQIDTFVDISEADLQRIYALALGHQHQQEAGTPSQAQATESAPGAAVRASNQALCPASSSTQNRR